MEPIQSRQRESTLTAAESSAEAPADNRLAGPSRLLPTRLPAPPAERDNWLSRRISGPEEQRSRGALRRRLLAYADWMAAAVAVLAVYAIAGELTGEGALYAVLFTPVWILVGKLHGLYDNDHRRVRHSTFDEVPPLFSTALFSTLALVGLLSLTPAPDVGAAEAIQIALIAFAADLFLRGVVRSAWASFTRADIGAIVGSGELAATIVRRLAQHPEARIDVVGFIGPADSTLARIGIPCFGTSAEIEAIAAEHGVERVIIAEEQISSADIRHVIEACHHSGLALTLVPANPEVLGPGIELNRIAELPLLDFRISDPSRSTMAIKRALDLVVSSLSLLLLAPLFALIAIAIRIDSRGPVFFRQERCGKGGEPFTIVKFRSMDDGAEARLDEVVDLSNLAEPAFKVRNDPRVTRVGRFLRRTSLDELPQLINVLTGHMSLVGPRPEESAVVELYDERQRVRLAAKPGLTGPMQVYGRGDLSFEERLAIERDYLENPSILSDLAIILRTPRAVIRGDGAY